MSDGDVIDLRIDPDRDVPVRRRQRERKRFCGHQRVDLDHPARRVYCRDCEDEVDAFTALENFASHFERWTAHRDRAEAEARHAQAQLDDLKRQVRNAKAQLRRADDGLARLRAGLEQGEPA